MMERSLNAYREEMLELAKEVANERGGCIISVETAGNLTNTHVSVTCSEGHSFRSSMHSIKFGNGGKGTWCPSCGMVMAARGPGALHAAKEGAIPHH